MIIYIYRHWLPLGSHPSPQNPSSTPQPPPPG